MAYSSRRRQNCIPVTTPMEALAVKERVAAISLLLIVTNTDIKGGKWLSSRENTKILSTGYTYIIYT